jgi:hypothetical protein
MKWGAPAEAVAHGSVNRRLLLPEAKDVVEQGQIMVLRRGDGRVRPFGVR